MSDNRNSAGTGKSAETISINDLPGLADIGKFDDAALGNANNANREVYQGDREDMFDPDNFLSEAEKEIIINELGGTGVTQISTPKRQHLPAQQDDEDEAPRSSGMSALQRKILGL